MAPFIAFPILLGVLITVHELGHFLVAKLCGVRVLTFSIGFGPRLVGFVRGDTEYRLSLIPLGGYVRMYGDDAMHDVPPDQRRYAFLDKPFLQKSAIAAAGPLANMLLTVAIFFATSVGTKSVAAPIVGTVMPGEVADAAGLQAGDRVIAIDGKSIHTFDDMRAFVGPRAGTPLRFTIERDGDPLDIVITPRAAPSPTPLEPDATEGRIGVLNGTFAPSVVGDARARAAGIVDGDRVVKVNGVPVATREVLLAALQRAPDRVELEVVTPESRDDKGNAVPEKRRVVSLTRVAPPRAGALDVETMAVTREDLSDPALAQKIAETRARTLEALHARARHFGLQPSTGLVISVEPEGTADAMGLAPKQDVLVALDGRALHSADIYTPLMADPDGIHALGVLTAEGARVEVFRLLPSPRRELAGLKVIAAHVGQDVDAGPTVEKRTGVLEAFMLGLKATGAMTVEVVKAFEALLTGKLGLAGIGGPISIARASGEAASAGVDAFLYWMAFFSVNLAVLNLLPIPVLDGGHLLLFTVEAIQRKRLTPETRIKATKIGLLLVAILVVIALSNDILSLL